jgi:hypothetical protein
MLGGAPALSDQARIGPEAGIHWFERLLMQMTGDETTLRGGAAGLEGTACAIARRIDDQCVTLHQLLAGKNMTRWTDMVSLSAW